MIALVGIEGCHKDFGHFFSCRYRRKKFNELLCLLVVVAVFPSPFDIDEANWHVVVLVWLDHEPGINGCIGKLDEQRML